MIQQMTFGSLAWAAKKKQTKREKFLGEMGHVVPWGKLTAIIEPYYPKAANGRRPMPLERMVRIYFLQQCYALSDPAMEEALYDIESVRRFAGIELGDEEVADETTILNFRHLLKKHGLTDKLWREVNGDLREKKLLLREGTIVDATLIAAPSSTKNQDKARDPEMSSTRKGNNYHFGMKVHAGVDSQSGLVHTVKITTASVDDKEEMEKLLHGQERAVFGDKGYLSDQDKRAARKKGLFWGVLDKAKRGKALSRRQHRKNRMLASIRAKVEHPFRVIKRQFGYIKTRYRGLAKNAAQVYALFALANLYMARSALLA